MTDTEIRALYAAFARGKAIWRFPSESTPIRWVQYRIQDGIPLGHDGCKWSLTGPTRTVTIELPGCVKEPLNAGEKYFLMSFSDVDVFTWDSGDQDAEWLSQGRIFRTEADAEAARDALLKALRGE